MMRVSRGLMLALCAILTLATTALSALAAGDETTHRKDEKPEISQTDSLQHTQKRLKDLIKAAAEQNLLALEEPPRKKTTTKTQPKPSENTDNLEQAHACKSSTFSFPSEAHISNFDQIQSLKNHAIDGKGQIDFDGTKTLALAYLGLGFADEALYVSNALEGENKAEIQAMAEVLLESPSATNQKMLQSFFTCNKNGNTWSNVMGGYQSPLTELETKNTLAYLKTLPEGLRNILGGRLGILALDEKDPKFAKTIYGKLLKKTGNNSDAHHASPQAQPALQFFKAAYELQYNSNPIQNSENLRILKSIAQMDSPYQVQALELVSTHHARHTKSQEAHGNKGQNGEIYPGFAQDLDAAAQTFATHKNGRQAITQQVTHLAKSHSFDKAIQLTKNNFETTDELFQESVEVVGEFVHADLQDNDANIKMAALDVLLREADFFEALKNLNVLNHAGVHAAAQLMLPKLAAEIMPIDTWHSLGVPTQTLLALSLKRDGDARDALSVFSKEIYQQDVFKALAIEKAFTHNNPARAVKISNNTPDSEVVQSTFKTQAWKAGYWSLVDGQIRTEKNKSKSGTPVKPDNNTKTSEKTAQKLPPAARNLAANLSANAPMLVTNNQAYDITELKNLQLYLDNDLAVFQTYIQTTDDEVAPPTSEQKSGRTNG